MKLDRGHLTLFSLRGAPVRIHWTMPVGAFVFGGMTIAPVFWLAFLVLILVHELGHALFVRRLGHRVVGIDVTGLGGVCRWTGHASDFQRGLIAWGGVTAQAAVLLATLVVTGIVGSPSSAWGVQLAHALVTTNLWLIALNLIPVQPFDGAEAWPVARVMLRRLRAPWRARSKGPGRSSQRPAIKDAGKTPSASRPSSTRTHSARAQSSNELADLLRGVADDAHRARQGRPLPRTRR